VLTNSGIPSWKLTIKRDRNRGMSYNMTNIAGTSIRVQLLRPTVGIAYIGISNVYDPDAIFYKWSSSTRPERDQVPDILDGSELSAMQIIFDANIELDRARHVWR